MRRSFFALLSLLASSAALAQNWSAWQSIPDRYENGISFSFYKQRNDSVLPKVYVRFGSRYLTFATGIISVTVENTNTGQETTETFSFILDASQLETDGRYILVPYQGKMDLAKWTATGVSLHDIKFVQLSLKDKQGRLLQVFPRNDYVEVPKREAAEAAAKRAEEERKAEEARRQAAAKAEAARKAEQAARDAEARAAQAKRTSDAASGTPAAKTATATTPSGTSSVPTPTDAMWARIDQINREGQAKLDRLNSIDVQTKEYMARIDAEFDPQIKELRDLMNKGDDGDDFALSNLKSRLVMAMLNCAMARKESKVAEGYAWTFRQLGTESLRNGPAGVILGFGVLNEASKRDREADQKRKEAAKAASKVATIQGLIQNRSQGNVFDSSRGDTLETLDRYDETGANGIFRAIERNDIAILRARAMTDESIHFDKHREVGEAYEDKFDDPKYGQSIMQAVVLKGDHDMIALLVASADRFNKEAAASDVSKSPWVATELGLPPLAIAAEKGDTEVVRLLLDYHAYSDGAKPSDLKHEAWSHVTPLMLAAAKGNTDVVKELLARGADRNIRGKSLKKYQGGYYTPYESFSGKTALDLAKKNGHADIVTILTSKETFAPTRSTIVVPDFEAMKADAKAKAEEAVRLEEQAKRAREEADRLAREAEEAARRAKVETKPAEPVQPTSSKLAIDDPRYILKDRWYAVQMARGYFKSESAYVIGSVDDAIKRVDAASDPTLLRELYELKLFAATTLMFPATKGRWPEALQTMEGAIRDYRVVPSAKGADANEGARLSRMCLEYTKAASTSGDPIRARQSLLDVTLNTTDSKLSDSTTAMIKYARACEAFQHREWTLARKLAEEAIALDGKTYSDEITRLSKALVGEIGVQRQRQPQRSSGTSSR